MSAIVGRVEDCSVTKSQPAGTQRLFVCAPLQHISSYLHCARVHLRGCLRRWLSGQHTPFVPYLTGLKESNEQRPRPTKGMSTKCPVYHALIGPGAHRRRLKISSNPRSKRYGCQNKDRHIHSERVCSQIVLLRNHKCSGRHVPSCPCEPQSSSDKYLDMVVGLPDPTKELYER